MIVSKEITIKIEIPPTNQQIESAFEEMGLKVLRWAITKVEYDKVTLNIAVET